MENCGAMCYIYNITSYNIASLIDTAAVQVRAFVVSADGNMSPLAPVPFSQTLEIPAK